MAITATVHVPDLDSEEDADRIERELAETRGVGDVDIDVSGGQVEAAVHPTKIRQRKVVKKVIEDIGYEVDGCDRSIGLGF